MSIDRWAAARAKQLADAERRSNDIVRCNICGVRQVREYKHITVYECHHKVWHWREQR